MENCKLQLIANNVRLHILDSVYSAASGHIGGSLSVCDILTYLYFEEMQSLDVTNPKKADRDRFVLSKGHCAPALYGVLAEYGFFPKADVKTLRHTGSYLQGHPSMKDVPGVDMSTGSLGQGISAACGMAIAAKKNNDTYRVYAALGDGEIEEGQVWEAAMFASHYKLDNLCIFVDNNGLQIDGDISKVMSPLPIDEKFRSFGWNVLYADAHDFDSIRTACKQAKEAKNKPTAVIAHSVKGKGISFMENQAGWHGKAPNEEEYKQARTELEGLCK